MGHLAPDDDMHCPFAGVACRRFNRMVLARWDVRGSPSSTARLSARTIHKQTATRLLARPGQVGAPEPPAGRWVQIRTNRLTPLGITTPRSPIRLTADVP